MASMIEHTLGVVLTGGASRRMGRDKASIEFEGVTLLERSVAVLTSVFASVAVSGATLSDVGVPIIPDLVPGLGPLGGLDSAYGLADGRGIFLLAVDMPFVDTETVRAIADPQISAMSARVPVAGGRRQPLCAVYGGGLGPLVRDCIDGKDRSMQYLLRVVALQEVSTLADDVFTNVNTGGDLAAALKRTGRHRSTR